MRPAAVPLAAEGSDLLHHLLLDLALKAAVALAALAVLAVGMRLIWHRAGRPRPSRRPAPTPRSRRTTSSRDL